MPSINDLRPTSLIPKDLRVDLRRKRKNTTTASINRTVDDAENSPSTPINAIIGRSRLPFRALSEVIRSLRNYSTQQGFAAQYYTSNFTQFELAANTPTAVNYEALYDLGSDYYERQGGHVGLLDVADDSITNWTYTANVAEQIQVSVHHQFSISPTATSGNYIRLLLYVRRSNKYEENSGFSEYAILCGSGEFAAPLGTKRIEMSGTCGVKLAVGDQIRIYAVNLSSSGGAINSGDINSATGYVYIHRTRLNADIWTNNEQTK